MNIHSICPSNSVFRMFRQMQRLKWTLSLHKNILCNNKMFQRCCEPISRVICTDSHIQSCNYETHESEKEQQSFYLQGNLSKENFKIVHFRYFKLLILSNDCNTLEELLLTDEFQRALSRSPFLYDVNVVGGSQNILKEALPLHIYEDVLYENSSVDKPPVNGFNTVFISNSGSKQNVQNKVTEEQLLNIINRLTYSLVNFFEKPLDYSIYHQNIVFQNNIRGTTTKGLSAYAQTMYIMKFYGYIHFSKVKVEILKMTHHIEDGTVRVRWRVNGLPRHKIVSMLLKYKPAEWKNLPQEETEWLDGFSIFSVGDDGLIFKHVCDKMIPDDEPSLSKNVDLKSKVLGLLGLTPRGPAAGTINTLIPYCQSQDFFSSRKLT